MKSSAGVNWILLLIPIPELELNWLNPVRADLECPSFELEMESELDSTELNSALPSTELKYDTKYLISLPTIGLLLGYYIM